MARIFGLEAVRMADADVLPYDYVTYARDISAYLEAARRKAGDMGEKSWLLGWKAGDQKLAGLDFGSAQAAATRLAAAAERVHALQAKPTGDLGRLNLALRQAEAALLSEAGLPNRPWYRHMIYAPGEFTGYAAVVLPGVNEALDAKDAVRAAQQLTVLTQGLEKAARVLDGAE
jgi:N-acetylated-alpha-linked acidic dipeptidase